MSGYAGSLVHGDAVSFPGAGIIHTWPAGFCHAHRGDGDLDLFGIAIDVSPSHAAMLMDFGIDLRHSATLASQRVQLAALQIRDEFHNTDSLSELSMASILHDVAVSSMRERRTDDALPAQPWLRKLARVVRERYNEQITLDELAADTAIHPVHISRTFRKVYGKTLGDYIRQLRIAEATRLLKHGSETIAEIGIAVGFFDASHFVRSFRKVIGTSPSNYRQLVRTPAVISLPPGREKPR